MKTIKLLLLFSLSLFVASTSNAQNFKPLVKDSVTRWKSKATKVGVTFNDYVTAVDYQNRAAASGGGGSTLRQSSLDSLVYFSNRFNGANSGYDILMSLYNNSYYEQTKLQAIVDEISTQIGNAPNSQHTSVTFEAASVAALKTAFDTWKTANSGAKIASLSYGAYSGAYSLFVLYR